MKVFCDLHHNDLYYSLQLLFEKRLGYEMYRPIGAEWWTEGFWKVYDHPATVQQYLGLHQAKEHPKDIHGDPLPVSAVLNHSYRVEDGIYYVNNPTKDVVNCAITLPKFKEMEFDIVISSIPQHIQPFNQLIQKYQPKAKHIFQVGNAWQQQPGVENILASTASFPVSQNINIYFYHQEFDLEVFRYESPTIRNAIYSYIHLMARPELLEQYRQHLPGWDVKPFGAGMPQSIMKTDQLAQKMMDSAFTWHYKPEGDGYGHVIHNTFAMGRPAIVWVPHYNGKLARQLFEDGVTCIDISKGSVEENIGRILYFSQPEEHDKICRNAYARFGQVVDFNKEEQGIRKFLEDLR
jgi:hypothetical protein